MNPLYNTDCHKSIHDLSEERKAELFTPMEISIINSLKENFKCGNHMSEGDILFYQSRTWRMVREDLKSPDFLDMYTRKTLRKIMLVLYPYVAETNPRAFMGMSKIRMYRHLLGYAILKDLNSKQRHPRRHGTYGKVRKRTDILSASSILKEVYEESEENRIS